MCRPEKPITTRNKALRELAEWLRDQRERTQQGYRALSVRAGFHATTLQRAASGESVPKLHTVLGYARACDASPEEARRLWKRARYEETRRARGGRGRPSPRPELIRDFVDMSAALHDLYEKAGSPALRTMEQRAGNFGVLPRSTVHRIVTKQAMPHSKQQFQAYLRACEVPETEWRNWEGAWTRAWRHEKQDDFVTRRAITGDTPLSTIREIVAAAEIASRGDMLTRASVISEYTTHAQEQLLRERVLFVAARGPQEGVAHSLPRQTAAQVGPRQPLPSRRRRRRQPHHRARAVQEQFDLAIGESMPEPDVLF
ncbi:helix-turn-helix domain-containing protein [Streptomyces longwoodensis]|uniref:helix-turn-helix domain-containing protein n=1 Tax=Streptomyces longwoodensis TaxID=68231 RepID=UPI00384DDE79